MDRRSLIKNAGIAGVLAAGAAPAIIHAQATLRWRCASSFPNRSTHCSVFATYLLRKLANCLAASSPSPPTLLAN